MNLRTSSLIMLAILGASASGQGQQRTLRTPEQTEFSAEDEGVKRPVAVPADVLATLSKDKMVEDILKDQKLSADKPPQSWFAASVVHLSTKGRADLVVKGEPPVVGANIIPFWVFRVTDHGYELVLTNRAHDLEVKKRRWNGYHVIVMSAETAEVFTEVEFRWDGKRLAEFREKSRDLK